MFIQTGITVFDAIFQLFLVSLVAGILTRRGIISGVQVSALSDTTVKFFLPCLIMAKTLARFNPDEITYWWIMPLSGVIMVVSGLVISGILYRFRPEKRPMMTLASMQNALYIVLPIGQILFKDQFDLFALYCFLLVLGLNPVMWSLGKVMISGRLDSGIRLKDFVTPPLTAIVASVVMVFTGISHLIPHSVLTSVDLLGQASVPVAVFVLGATMGAMSLRAVPALSDILKVALVKFVIIPASAFAILYLSRIHLTMPLLCSVVMIQACAPPATNLILIVKSYGGDAQSVSAMMLIMYLLSIVAMPVWIAAWLTIAG